MCICIRLLCAIGLLLLHAFVRCLYVAALRMRILCSCECTTRCCCWWWWRWPSSALSSNQFIIWQKNITIINGQNCISGVYYIVLNYESYMLCLVLLFVTIIIKMLYIIINFVDPQMASSSYRFNWVAVHKARTLLTLNAMRIIVVSLN